jgi:hypothetical protein
MNGAIICPTMRPERAEWLREQYKRQRAEVPLIIVANGRASDQAWRYDFARAVIEGPQHKARCLELGKLAAESLGADWYACWDDDDYYGGAYLEHVAQAFEAGARWVGQRAHYMRTSKGRLWRTGPEGFILGCCLSTRVNMPGWSAYPNDVGPEGRWAKDHGVAPVVLPPGHFAHLRSGDHARHVWPASDEHIALRSGGAWDLGPWDPLVVDQDAAEPPARFVEADSAHVFLDPGELLARVILGVPSAELVT